MTTARLKEDLTKGPLEEGHVPQAAIEASKKLRRVDRDPGAYKDKFSEDKMDEEALPDDAVEKGVVDQTVERG